MNCVVSVYLGVHATKVNRTYIDSHPPTLLHIHQAVCRAFTNPFSPGCTMNRWVVSWTRPIGAHLDGDLV